MIVYHYNDKYMDLSRVSNLLYLSDCDVIEECIINKAISGILNNYPDLVIISSKNYQFVYKSLSPVCDELRIKIMISEESFWGDKLSDSIEVNHPLCFKANFNLNDISSIKKDISIKDIDHSPDTPIHSRGYVDIKIKSKNELLINLISDDVERVGSNVSIEYKFGNSRYSVFLKKAPLLDSHKDKSSEDIISVTIMGPIYKEVA